MAFNMFNDELWILGRKSSPATTVLQHLVELGGNCHRSSLVTFSVTIWRYLFVAKEIRMGQNQHDMGLG